MITIGIDMAAQPTNTAACRIDWGTGKTRVDQPCGDDFIAALLDEASGGSEASGCVVAIDAPFGWPTSFSDAVDSWTKGDEQWSLSYADHAEKLRHRECDIALNALLTSRSVQQTLTPISVSADKVGATAMRCAYLLSGWAGRSAIDCVHRNGLPVVECYPAAALAVWGIDRKGYKGKADGTHEARTEILRQLRDRTGLHIDGDAEIVATDHALDAFVSALIARAVALGAVEPRGVIENIHEGWIELPEAGALEVEQGVPSQRLQHPIVGRRCRHRPHQPTKLSKIRLCSYSAAKHASATASIG